MHYFRHMTHSLFRCCFLMVAFALMGSAALGGNPARVTGSALTDSTDRPSDDFLERIGFSGYIQALYQKAASKGITSFSGGDFGEGMDQRLTVRRGRLKMTYDAGSSQAVIQVDATERGVAIWNAYLLFKEKKWNTFGLKAGVQSREFGHEVAYSSSKRESPERSRLLQTLFSGERDVGVKLFVAPPAESGLSFLRLEGGFYNGSGPASDYDNNKDFIGRIHLDFEGKSSPWKLGLGASLYLGGQRQNTRYSYTMAPDNRSFHLDSAESNIGKTAKRRYYGADIQAGYAFPFGKTAVRAEYITGKQPGSSTSSKTPRSRPEEATYHRDFYGAYVILVQEFGRSPLNAFIKYDVYDPNRKVSGTEIDNGFTEGDIRFHTWGYGLAWHYDDHITFTAYYEDVRNEQTQQSGFTDDIRDNVLSLQIQYRF